MEPNGVKNRNEFEQTGKNTLTKQQECSKSLAEINHKENY